MKALQVLVPALLLTAIFAVAPASAEPCEVSGGTLSCAGGTSRCTYDAAANIITTTHVHAEADCRGGSMTRCHAEVGVGQDLFNPHVEHWCAF